LPTPAESSTKSRKPLKRDSRGIAIAAIASSETLCQRQGPVDNRYSENLVDLSRVGSKCTTAGLTIDTTAPRGLQLARPLNINFIPGFAGNKVQG